MFKHTTSLASFAQNIQPMGSFATDALPSVNEFNNKVAAIESKILNGTVTIADFNGPGSLSLLVVNTTSERQQIFDDLAQRARLANANFDSTTIAPVSTSVSPEPQSLAPAGLFSEPTVIVENNSMSSLLKIITFAGGAYLLYRLMTRKKK